MIDMKLPWMVFTLLWLAMLSACDSAAPNNVETAAPEAPIVMDLPATPSASKIAENEAPARPLPGGYEILGNMEIVQYCLPYPKDEFKEDYDLAEYKGQHVLVSKNKKSKITFAGNPVDMTLDALYDKCVADIMAIKGASLVSENKFSDGFSMRWKVGEKVFFMKKWYRQDAQESVTATFEFPASEEAAFAVWIEDITGQSGECE